jgi:hypothetical protein
MKTLLLFLMAASLWAQNTRTVTLTWADATNPVGTTYSIYRASGTCNGTPTFTRIASGLTVKTYADAGIAPGNYCYVATATVNSMESDQSASAGAAVRPFVVTGLNVTVQ